MTTGSMTGSMGSCALTRTHARSALSPVHLLPCTGVPYHHPLPSAPETSHHGLDRQTTTTAGNAEQLKRNPSATWTTATYDVLRKGSLHPGRPLGARRRAQCLWVRQWGPSHVFRSFWIVSEGTTGQLHAGGCQRCRRQSQTCSRCCGFDSLPRQRDSSHICTRCSRQRASDQPCQTWRVGGLGNRCQTPAWIICKQNPGSPANQA